MPIHLNLLAEAQAAEEERRRNPVKRAIWIAILFVVLILVWSSSLQLKAILIRSEVSRVWGSTIVPVASPNIASWPCRRWIRSNWASVSLPLRRYPRLHNVAIVAARSASRTRKSKSLDARSAMSPNA